MGAASGHHWYPASTIEDTLITELHRYHSRELTITWQPGLKLCGDELVTQVYGFCLTQKGQVLLVSKDGDSWTLPGGRPEPGETHAETLAREVWEESCAQVTAQHYLGAQRVDESRARKPYYQLRYLAHVSIELFRPQHEMRFRKLVDIETAKGLLWGGRSRIGKYLLEHIQEVSST